MKHIIIAIFISLYLFSCYLWLQLSGEDSMGSCLALFMSTLNGIDHFIISAVVSYFWGILLVISYIVFSNYLTTGINNHKIVILWATTYPLLVLFGIFLYQIKVFESRSDQIYIIIASIVVVYIIYYISKKLPPAVRNRTTFYIVFISYIVAITATILPNEMKTKYLTSEYSKSLFEVPALGQFVIIETQDDFIDVEIGENTNKDNSTLHFRYRRESSSDNLDSNCIFVCFYGNKVLFRPEKIEIINYSNYELTDLNTVLYQYENIEYQIYNKNIICKQRTNNSWEYLDVKKISRDWFR